MSDGGGISVFLLAIHESKPVFHFDGGTRQTKDAREWLTACGRVWGSLSYDKPPKYWQAMFMPLRHARKFGQPCKVCKRRLAAARLLEKEPDL